MVAEQWQLTAQSGIGRPSTGTRRGRILVIDDDEDFVPIVSHLLESSGHRCCHASSATAARAAFESQAFDLCLLDYRLGDTDGLELIRPLRAIAPRTPIALLTAYQDPELVVRALQRGAVDFLTKPVDEVRLFATLGHAIREHDLAAEVARLTAASSQRMVGQSPAMDRARSELLTVAPTSATVLITGESGTGKELAAHTVHDHSEVRGGPLVAINMATLPTELAESTLFGHEKGAFTGAVERRKGACAAANEGTLFLDEVGEMPLTLQAKILRFLQEGTYSPVGSNREHRSSARILAATNRDLAQCVHDGTFREDLYYRLNVVPIELPPLRDRAGDIELLAHHALRASSIRHGREFKGIDRQAMEILVGHRWPGNVRELTHVIERVVILNSGPYVRVEMLPEWTRGRKEPVPSASEEASPTTDRASADIEPLAVVERTAILEALRACRGSVAEAASRLEISPATIYRRLKSWGVESDRLRP